MARLEQLAPETLQDLIYLSNGVFAPLDSFMDEETYHSVVDHMRLPDGAPWTIPITLDAPEDLCRRAAADGLLEIFQDGRRIAHLTGCTAFPVNEREIEAVFQTLVPSHPGVAKERLRHPFRVGGKVHIDDPAILDGALSPEETKAAFAKKGFRTVVGFQTRNPIHRAHEYLQRTALEVCDGLFINPIVGWKKTGDFTQEAVMAAYHKMTGSFFPKERVHLAGLKTQMRYAGPREAVFHAIVRRNLGCTHFIIGRDHAGVGGFYGAYEAHDLARTIQEKADLGIELFLFREPFYCGACGQVVTDKTCAHGPEDRLPISGTEIRRQLSTGGAPDGRMMRGEIADAIINLGKDHIFIQ